MFLTYIKTNSKSNLIFASFWALKINNTHKFICEPFIYNAP